MTRWKTHFPFLKWFHAGFFSKAKQLNVSFLSKPKIWKVFFLRYKRKMKIFHISFYYFLERGETARKGKVIYYTHTHRLTLASHTQNLSLFQFIFGEKFLIAWVESERQRPIAILIARQKELKWYFIIFLRFLLCRHHTRRCVSSTIIISNLISFWFAPLPSPFSVCK